LSALALPSNATLATIGFSCTAMTSAVPLRSILTSEKCPVANNDLRASLIWAGV
jgi:hypothetical protein